MRHAKAQREMHRLIGGLPEVVLSLHLVTHTQCDEMRPRLRFHSTIRRNRALDVECRLTI